MGWPSPSALLLLTSGRNACSRSYRHPHVAKLFDGSDEEVDIVLRMVQCQARSWSAQLVDSAAGLLRI